MSSFDNNSITGSNSINIVIKDYTKILYKDFIKSYHHPSNQKYENIKIYAQDIFLAYLEVIGEKYTIFKKDIIDTQKYRYYLITDNDYKLFKSIFNSIVNLKRKCIIVLMLSAEFINISMIESMKTNKFSNMFKDMTTERLHNNGIDIKWLTKHNFFK